MNSISLANPVALCLYLQPGTSSPMHNAQQSSNVSTQQSSQATSKSAEETSFEVGVQPLSAETTSSGRKELPEVMILSSIVSDIYEFS